MPKIMLWIPTKSAVFSEVYTLRIKPLIDSGLPIGDMTWEIDIESDWTGKGKQMETVNRQD